MPTACEVPERLSALACPQIPGMISIILVVIKYRLLSLTILLLCHGYQHACFEINFLDRQPDLMMSSIM